MMLPSGNDAAQSLAIHFGLVILREKYSRFAKQPGFKQEQIHKDRNFEILKIDMNNYCNIDDDYPDLIDSALQMFYNEMNEAASEINLKNTNFCSAHGMHHDQNYSSA